MASLITLVLPSEQAGARTGRKYEVQYEEAALACLKLLQEGDATCVYCEWHDDFVVERQGSEPRYAFHQVKTRADTRGDWSMFEVLGIKKPRKQRKARKSTAAPGPTVAPTSGSGEVLVLRDGKSIAHRMLEHYRKFEDACAIFALVSPTDIESDSVLLLVKACKAAGALENLTGKDRDLFNSVVNAYKGRDGATTENEIWGLLTRLDFVQGKASEQEPGVAIGLMGQMIYDLSEVDVAVSEQARIADGLLKVVRQRSHAVLKTLPSEEEVRREKAISLRDVIKLLPLSLDGYERLKAGERQAVKSLSRLQRLCRAAGMKEELISVLCDLKVTWHEWRGRVGDSLTADLLGVLTECGLGLLGGLTSGRSSTPFADLRASAIQEAQKLAAVPGMPPLDPNVLLGLVFALAAESQ